MPQQYNATALIVDDRDSSVVYSSGWQQVSSTAEYMLTKSGADKAGMTAKFTFTGRPLLDILVVYMFIVYI